jgi:NAD-dependent DNA ligase
MGYKEYEHCCVCGKQIKMRSAYYPPDKKMCRWCNETLTFNPAGDVINKITRGVVIPAPPVEAEVPKPKTRPHCPRCKSKRIQVEANHKKGATWRCSQCNWQWWRLMEIDDMGVEGVRDDG